MDYNTAEPAVRWDSYENFNQHHEDSVDGVRGTWAGGMVGVRGTLLPLRHTPLPRQPWAPAVCSAVPAYHPPLLPTRLAGPHAGSPGWQSLCSGAACPPPDPTGTLSRATPTPYALCQQRLWPFLHTDHRADCRVPWPATPVSCRTPRARSPPGRLWSDQWRPGGRARDGHPR